MRTSDAGRKAIETWEGLALRAYQDQRGIWSLGYGHTQGVKEGDTCTPPQADEWLAGDLDVAEMAVNHHVKIPTLTQGQFDALVSLAFNIGSGAFMHSTLLRLLNEGNVTGAANQFLLWCRTNGEVNQGLLNRRQAERAMFLQA